MKKTNFLGLFLPILLFSMMVPLRAMDTQTGNNVRYYQGTPLTKETILAGLGPQLPEAVRRKTANVVDPRHAEIRDALHLPERLTVQSLKDQREKVTDIQKTDILVGTEGDNQKKYGLWAANPVNKAISLWHGDPQTREINVWDAANRTDENFGKIVVKDSCQTISARACFLALLAARAQMQPTDQKRVKVIPAYLYQVPGEPTNNSDENYVVIHKRAPQAIVLAKNPEVIPSIPAEAIATMFSMIMDERSGAAGALWENEDITVEKDETGSFKRWVVGLREKPNNQEPNIFFNQGPGFHANCQFEGLRTLALVLDKSEDKKALNTLCDLIERNKAQFCEQKGEHTRWPKIEAQILTLRKK